MLSFAKPSGQLKKRRKFEVRESEVEPEKETSLVATAVWIVHSGSSPSKLSLSASIKPFTSGDAVKQRTAGSEKATYENFCEGSPLSLEPA